VDEEEKTARSLAISTGKVAGDALSISLALIMAAWNGNLVFILIRRELLFGGEPEGLPTKSARLSIPRAAFLLGQKVALLLSF